MKNLLKFSAFIFLLCLSTNAMATAQIPDKLVYKGKKHILHTNPLEYFFTENPDRLPAGGAVSTALWRGYVATFEIADGMLFVKDVEIDVYSQETKQYVSTSALHEVFPGEASPIPMLWYSGLLIVPQGRLKNYVHMGYASEYAGYLVIEVRDGKVTREEKFSRKGYRKFRQKQFEAFKKSDQYQQMAVELRENDPTLTDEFIEHFLSIYVVDYLPVILD